MQQELMQNKWIQFTALGVLFGSIASYAFTGLFLWLALPFVFLFGVLTILNWKTVYWILLFTVPASAQLFFLGDSLSTSLPDEPIMWLFLLVFVLMLARNPGILPEWWWRNKIVLVLVLQFLWLIVAVIFSNELFISLKFLAAKSWFLVSFVVLPVLVFKEKKDYKRAFLLLLIPMLITVIIIFFRHMLYNFNFRKIEKAIMGVYYNHVDYSTVISMFFPVMCMAYPLTKGVTWWKRLLLLGIILFFLPAIYLTYARAAMLAVVFAFVVWFAIRKKIVNWIMPAFYGLIALLLVYMVKHNKYIDYRPNYEQTYMHFTFTDHMIATFRGQDMSSMERLYRWIAAIRMSEDRPVTGYGPNSFYYYYKPYALSVFRTYVSRNPEQSTTHNYFLFMLVGQGWPAMLLYATFVMVVFAQAQKTYHRFKDRFYKHVTMAAVMMFAAGFVNNFFSELLETHKVGALFFLSVAVLIVLDRKSRDLESSDQVVS
jgi:O-antigen ligase